MALNPNVRTTNPRLLRAAAICVQAAAVKVIAHGIPDPLKTQLDQRANLTITNVADDFCGTRIRFLVRDGRG